MKTIVVEYDDVIPERIGRSLSDTETTLAIGNRRFPASLTDKQTLLVALAVSDAIAAANHAWRGDIVTALRKLDAKEKARENATT
ncbi:hypothetical protein [Streptosporangium sp. NPDC001681]|uniref:hypothetical protein n=1 Tax=Streptosporangium sp. NPDC001681 TaxID=3154395 RepID=UPI00331BE2D4